MVKFETVKELTLAVTMDSGDYIFSKAGAFVMGQSPGQKNYQFEKVLLGPQGNPVQAALGQVFRRFTGENLPLMKVKAQGNSITYYANKAQHVVALTLDPGDTISVESENLLAFTPDCKYGVRFLAQGVISQKGLATSTLTGNGPNAQVAILLDGNPLTLSNQQNGMSITVDPDAVVAWIGSDPEFKLDLSWKNFIGQASGESYMFEWPSNKPAVVITQPNERDGSGLNLGMDGGSSGQRASRQNNPHLRDATQNVSETARNLGNMVNNLLGGGGSGGTGGGTGGFGNLM